MSNNPIKKPSSLIGMPQGPTIAQQREAIDLQFQKLQQLEQAIIQRQNVERRRQVELAFDFAVRIDSEMVYETADNILAWIDNKSKPEVAEAV